MDKKFSKLQIKHMHLKCSVTFKNRPDLWKDALNINMWMKECIEESKTAGRLRNEFLL